MRLVKRAPLVLLALVGLVAPAPAPAGAAAKPNPCLDDRLAPALLCPDLKMKRPFDLSLDPTVKPGRVVLRAGNSIDNVGRGPAELSGVRSGRFGMRAAQRIYRRDGGRLGIFTGAKLFFKFVQGQTRYWKWRRAERFELWRLDDRGRRARLVRRGPKRDSCLRDLGHPFPRKPGSPRRRVYPSCSTEPSRRLETIGTSVGWSDIYPASYPEQWIDVTGLRGCFAYRHVVDPSKGIFESNERNNAASRVVRLPYRGGAGGCPGTRPLDPRRAPQADLPVEP